MQLIINTTIDEDVGLEAIQGQLKDSSKIEVFATDLVHQFLSNLKPTVDARYQTLLKRAIDEAATAKLDEAAAVLGVVAPVVDPIVP